MSANGGPYKVPVGLHPDFPRRGRLGDHARLVSYLQRLAAAFSRGGQCWVTVTGLDGRPIGGALCFTNAGQAYGVKTSFIAMLEYKTASPGFRTICHAIEEAIRRGATRFPFLSGDPGWARLMEA